MSSGMACVIAFNLTNPSIDQTSPAVSVAATLNHVGVSIAEVAMDKPHKVRYGVANASDPLQVLAPRFKVKSIAQSKPAPAMINTITVTLTANYDIADGSTVTISGLTGSQTPDAGSLSVTSSNDDLGTTGAWTQSSGSWC